MNVCIAKGFFSTHNVVVTLELILYIRRLWSDAETNHADVLRVFIGSF